MAENAVLIHQNNIIAASVFGSVVVVAFRIAFRVKIHANDIFFIF